MIISEAHRRRIQRPEVGMRWRTLLTNQTSRAQGNADPIANRRNGPIIACTKEKFVQLVNSVPKPTMKEGTHQPIRAG